MLPGNSAVVPMDVDTGTCLARSPCSQGLTSFSSSLDTPSSKDRAKSVRMLPFELVPKMDTTSFSFIKAQLIIMKSTGTSPAKDKVETLFNLQQGEPAFYLW